MLTSVIFDDILLVIISLALVISAIMSVCQLRMRQWPALTQANLGVQWRTGAQLVCVLLLAYGCPFACFLQAWMHMDGGLQLSIHRQAHGYFTQSALGHAAGQTGSTTTDCIFCRNHDVTSLFIDAALLTLVLLVFSLLTSTPFRINSLFLRFIPQAPPLRPPRQLAV